LRERERAREARESMTRIKIKKEGTRIKKVFVSYVFFLSIFMSVPLADRKREKERERARSKSHMIIK
jgi:hypothetical protein